MPNTTTTEVPSAVANFYDRSLLERATPFLFHTKFGQVRDIPQKMSESVKFRKYGALTPATTPLSEGVTPTGSQLSITDITANVDQYGDFIILTDFVLMTTIDPILMETAEILGEQAGQTIDIIARDILEAGTNVQYANGVANRGLVATGLDLDEIRIGVNTLDNANAKRITRMVSPDTGYSTRPLNSCFISIINPDTTLNLKALTDFIPVEKYANKSDVMEGEVGAVDNVRFIQTTHGKVFTGEGASSADVYGTLILGKDAYGITRISGEAMRNIVKSLGSAGTADPLEQRASSGWKATFVAKILQQLWMLRIEHTN